MGDAFDPNLHNAMFELPDPSKEPGSVAHIVKVRGVHRCCVVQATLRLGTCCTGEWCDQQVLALSKAPDA